MTQLTQEVDSIIAEENINDSVPAAPPDEPVEDPVVDPATPPADPKPEEPKVEPPKDETPKEDEPKDDPKDDTDPKVDPEPPKEEAPTSPAEPKIESLSPSETVQEAQTLIGNLNLTQDKVFNEDGSVKPWEEVVPAGAFLGSQLTPVKVTDKDGKTHEFLLLSDVEKMFPDGFETKNRIEQMKFEKAIMSNEDKFDKAIETYKSAKEQYTKETSDIVQAQSDNQRINKEYRAMADQGLVPKVEGDPSDPKFLEQPAVKELNKILEWQEAKNKENSAKGLGQITSIYVAKQLMDIEGKASDKKEEASKIVKDRQEVASLSSSPAPAKESPKKVDRNIPMSRLADEIIASEGLR